MSYFVFYMQAVADQLPRLGKREVACLLSLTCNYVVSVRRGFFFLWVLGIGCIILLGHCLDLPYNYFTSRTKKKSFAKFDIVAK